MKINNVSRYQQIIKKEAESEINKSDKKIEDNNSCNFDISDFDAAVDFEHLTKLTLENLVKNNKNISIYIGTFENKNDIKNYALATNDGKSLIISPEFIKKMGSSYESFENGKAVLEGVIKQLSESSSVFKSTGTYVDEEKIINWHTYEQPPIIDNSFTDALKKHMESMQQESENIRNKLKLMNSKSILNAPSEVYSKLAQAKNVAGVKNVMAMARFKATRLKSMLRSCEEADEAKIRASIRQIEKAITRGQRKVKDLTSEDNMRSEQRKAEALNEQKKAERKRIELQKKKVIRHIREHAQIDEGNPWYYYPQEMLNKKNDNIDEDYFPQYIPDNIIAQTNISIDTAPINTAVVADISSSVEISI